MRIAIEGVKTLNIALGAVALAIAVFAVAYETTPTTPPVEVSIQDRTNVLLATCFPAPAYTYTNAAPVCEGFKQYVIEQADKFDAQIKTGH